MPGPETINPDATINPEVVRLLTEAAEWRLLGMLFEYPSESWRERVAALLPDVRDENLRSLGGSALEYSTEGLHTALFGPAGTVPVREVTYQGGVQSGYLMAELAAYYDAFGYRPALDEADDHLAVELGFLSYLKLKQASAIASGDHEHASIAAEAAAAFTKDHVAVQAEPVANALENFAPDYLIAAGSIILQHAGPAPRTSYPLGAPLPGDGDSDDITCGPSAAGNDLVQLQP